MKAIPQAPGLRGSRKEFWGFKVPRRVPWRLRLRVTTVDGESLRGIKDPKLCYLWYIPFYGSCRIYIISRTWLWVSGL